MPDRICVLCAYYHPRADPHAPDRGQTCASGRRRLESDVLSLRSEYRRLLEERPHLEVLIPAKLPEDATWGADDSRNQALPAASVPSPSKQPSVSGSKERRIPLTDLADLTAGVQHGTVSDPYGDQVGRLSVATVIYQWVVSWHERFFANQRRPAAHVPTMFDWILGVRLELVCDADEAITDFAAEIADLRGAARHHLGEVAPRKQPMWGVTCPRCDMMSQLMLDPEDPDKYRECANCGKMMSPDEYHAHLRELVDQYRAGRNLARG